MRITQFLAAALAAAALLLVSVSAQAGNPRIALVIGESAYPDAALPTAANDAGLVAQVLQAAGFDVVGARDLDQKGVRESLRDFIEKANAAGPDMQAFVYFSGRALQYSGDNYLAPIDARIARDSDVPIEAIRLSDFTHALAGAPGLARVVVIDGARANPYAQQGQPLAGGLALVEPEPNTILAFNAAPGAIGVEDAGDYGVYAKALAGLMRQGGVDISDILEQTRIAVNQKTQGAQLPWSAGKLGSPYFLFERAADAAPVKPRFATKKPLRQLSVEDAYQVVIARDRLSDYEEFLRDHARSEQARRIEAILAARREALFWRRALDANSPRAYWTYLRRYPRGPHAYDAYRRLDALAARREPPPGFAVLEFDGLPPPPPREIVYADRPVYYFGGDDFGPPPPPPPPAFLIDERDEDWDDLPPPPRPTVAGLLPTLAVAIPLLIAARAYHDRPRRDGRAPPSAPPPRHRIGPPPLPHGVHVEARPTPTPLRPPRAEKGPGQVKFAPPPTATPGGRPPAPVATPQLNGRPPREPARTLLPGAPNQGGKPTLENGKTPLPGATLAPGRQPAVEPGKTPGLAPTHRGKATPESDKTPLPTPSATPVPGRQPVVEPGKTPGLAPTHRGKATPESDKTPLPTPGATPVPGRQPAVEPGKTPGLAPTHRGKAAPEGDKTPLPTPLPGRKPAMEPGRTPTPAPIHGAKPAPNNAGTLAPAKTPAAAKSAPGDEARPAHMPKAHPEPRKLKPVEAPKLPPRAEPAKPAPRIEPAKPAPRIEHVKPAPRAEPARPALAPRVEPVRPAPAPRVEPRKLAPAARPAAACGHPGQPRC